jgi:hypothetical protein
MPLTDIQIVRLNIGDKEPDAANQHFTDAEIQHFIDTAAGDLDTASGDAAVRLALYFGTKADQTTGRVSTSFSDRASTYWEIAQQFGTSAQPGELAPVYVGGLSRSEIDSSREDTDLVQPAFTRDLNEDPAATTDPLTEVVP